MDVFFYGLFMDEAILLKNGITPSNPRIGYLNNYVLRIGNRASLIPCMGERSYGIVMTVDNKAIKNLYASPGVSDYIPEEVDIFTNTNSTIVATCYNLPTELMTGTNRAYANSLYELARKVGFPDEYLEKIEKMTKPTFKNE